MNCRTVRRLLPLHSGRDLAARRAVAVEAHLAACPACREELARWDGIRAEIRAARPAGVTASGVWERIAPRLDAIDAAARLRRPWYRRPGPWLGGVAAVLLVALALDFWRAAEPAPEPGTAGTLAAAEGDDPASGLVRVPSEQLEEFLHVQAALLRPVDRADRPFVQVVPVSLRVGEF